MKILEPILLLIFSTSISCLLRFVVGTGEVDPWPLFLLPAESAQSAASELAPP
jgi:hypothetical protein